MGGREWPFWAGWDSRWAGVEGRGHGECARWVVPGRIQTRASASARWLLAQRETGSVSASAIRGVEHPEERARLREGTG